MPFVETPGCRLYYRLEGPDEAPVLILSHSLGLDHGQWSRQVAHLRPHFRVLTFDTRGHGASTAVEGDYTIEQLGRDVLAIADALDIDRFAFCGLSLGGMIGQWLGVHAADRLTRLVLANTTARVADPAGMGARRDAVLAQGMGAVIDAAMGRFFQSATHARRPGVVSAARRVMEATSPVGYAGCCAAIRDMDQREDVRAIRTPTLVISGDHDASMPTPDHAQVLADAIPDAVLLCLPTAHLSNLELPRTFSAELCRFLMPKPADSFEAGLPVRRAVLGSAHVERSMASATPLTHDFQELITRFAWGTVWTRPGLDRRTRRLLVLVITAALGRWEEFRLHLRAGVTDTLEWTDVQEALMQVAVYAGVPAANTAFAIAAEEQARSKNGSSAS
jgi:3-oxoadipate enol-lactonase/4-carboxymuconolactone decarboxylase